MTGVIGLLGATAPRIWTGLFTVTPEVHAVAAGYLAIIGLAFPFLGAGLTLATSFQAAGRPLWPLLGVTSRVLVVIVGGWLAVHVAGTDLTGLAIIAASGLVVYGASLATAFWSGTWSSVSATPPQAGTGRMKRSA